MLVLRLDEEQKTEEELPLFIPLKLRVLFNQTEITEVLPPSLFICLLLTFSHILRKFKFDKKLPAIPLFNALIVEKYWWDYSIIQYKFNESMSNSRDIYS